MTIAEKLDDVKNIKGQIRDAVNQKGGQLSQYAPFSEYPAAILGIPQEVTEGGGLDIYLREERIIGTWIDGKPIYRKVIYWPSLNMASTSMTLASGVGPDVVDTLTDFRFLTRGVSSSQWNCIGSGVGSVYFRDDGDLRIETSVNGRLKIIVVLEYTKTTDEVPES